MRYSAKIQSLRITVVTPCLWSDCLLPLNRRRDQRKHIPVHFHRHVVFTTHPNPLIASFERHPLQLQGTADLSFNAPRGALPQGTIDPEGDPREHKVKKHQECSADENDADAEDTEGSGGPASNQLRGA